MTEMEMNIHSVISDKLGNVGSMRKASSTGCLVIASAPPRIIPGELWGARNVLRNVFRQEAFVQSWQQGSSAELSTERPGLDYTVLVNLKTNVLLMYVAGMIVYAATKIVSFTGWYCTWRLGLALGFVAFVVLRSLYVERRYQANQCCESDLGDPDSHFKKVENVKVHYKVRSAASKSNPVQLGIHLYHGFGANVYSWAAVQKLLSLELGALVTAHDTPGFGLSQRKNEYRFYSLECNGRIGRKILQEELDQQAQQLNVVGSQQERILVGHSLGGVTAMVETVSNPEGINAVVLIAPAAVAVNSREESMVRMVRVAEQDDVLLYRATLNQSLYQRYKEQQQSDGSELKIASSYLERLVVALFKWFLFFSLVFITTFLRPVLLFILRKSVRSKQFWQRGLQSAYYDKSRLSDAMVDAYRKPKLVKGWEKGILLFTLARFRDGAAQLWRSLSQSAPQVNLANKFAETVLKHDIKVLIIHGEQDMLVPAGNSRRLARKIPGCSLALIDRCGHVPQEEIPEKFVQILYQFVMES